MISPRVVYVTFPSKQVAKDIIRKLVEEKLVACGNIFPITAIYSWQEEIHDEQEFAAHLKTTASNVMATRRRIKELHPFEVPCIVDWSMDGEDRYLDWIGDSVH